MHSLIMRTWSFLEYKSQLGMRKEANAWSYHECIWETLVMRKGNHNAMTIISDDQNFFPSIIFLKLEVHTQNLMIWLSNENDIQLWWLTQFLKYTVNTFFFALGRVVFFHRVILPTYFQLYTLDFLSIWIDFEETATILLWKDQNFASVLAQKSH